MADIGGQYRSLHGIRQHHGAGAQKNFAQVTMPRAIRARSVNSEEICFQ